MMRPGPRFEVQSFEERKGDERQIGENEQLKQYKRTNTRFRVTTPSRKHLEALPTVQITRIQH